jgi:hypothetical protein
MEGVIMDCKDPYHTDGSISSIVYDKCPSCGVNKNNLLLGVLFVFALLTGCGSPTKELYDSVQKTCPNQCGPYWTGQITVDPEFIRCECKE